MSKKHRPQRKTEILKTEEEIARLSRLFAKVRQGQAGERRDRPKTEAPQCPRIDDLPETHINPLP